MRRATLKSLWARKLRLAGSVLAVLLGVGAVAGTFVLTDSVRAGFDATTSHAAGDVPDDLDFAQVLLGAAGALALLVGGLVIHNTFAITVAQRTHDLALLRCLGATRRQLRNSVLLEALLLGGFVSLLGLVVGVGQAIALRALLEATGDQLPIDGLVVMPRTVLLALAVGLGVSVVSALGPARGAGRVPPVAALRQDVLAPDRTTTCTGAVAGTALVVPGVGLLVFGIVSGSPGPASFVGAVLTLLGAVALGPVLAGPLARVIGLPADRALGLPGKLARQNAARDPRRTAATATAMMIGLILVTVLVVLSGSVRASVASQIGRLMLADYRVERSDSEPLPAATVARLEQRPELALVMPFQSGDGRVAGEPAGITAVDPATLTRGIDLDIVSGRLADLQPGAMAVSRDVARAHAWSVGSTVSVQLERGSSELRVAAVYDTVTDVGGVPLGDITIGDHLLATEDFQRLSGNRRAAWIYVTAAGDVAPDQARAVIEQAADAGSNLVIRDRPALRRELLGQLNEAERVYGALLGLVILVSLFGVANTMALSVIERTRELGLLRSVGMDRTQIRAMIRWEAIVVTGIGAVAGVGLGILYGWAVVRAFSQSGVDLFRPPIGHLSLAIVLMALTGVAAAALPARRAGRINVLGAMATE